MYFGTYMFQPWGLICFENCDQWVNAREEPKEAGDANLIYLTQTIENTMAGVEWQKEEETGHDLSVEDHFHMKAKVNYEEREALQRFWDFGDQEG